jgi:hypothetical protein
MTYRTHLYTQTLFGGLAADDRCRFVADGGFT